jgi:hypothetical protein
MKNQKRDYRRLSDMDVAYVLVRGLPGSPEHDVCYTNPPVVYDTAGDASDAVDAWEDKQKAEHSGSDLEWALVATPQIRMILRPEEKGEEARAAVT